MIATELVAKLRAWVATEPVLPGALDPATQAFCRRTLRAWSETDVLERKLARELRDYRWQPLGRVLVVVAEGDVLGSIAALIAAVVTGNRVRIKARTNRPMLADLVRALAITECELVDWDSRDQDDRAALDGIDGVLLAGGDDLIRHYRRVTPPGVRLIELGPKLGCAAVGRGALDFDALAAALAIDVTLFGQGVCSSPQWILVDDDGTARALRDRLRARASTWPVLPAADRLVQHVRARELVLLARLGEPVEAEVDVRTGWGLTLGTSPAHRLPKGFALVVGPLDAQLAALARAYPHALQTLGTAGAVPEASAFTHRCPIGRMHERSPLEPHDGFLELAALVKLISREDA